MSELPNRRDSVTEEVKGVGFSLAVTVGFHPTFGHPCEIFITKRTKTGTALEEVLYEVGVATSKIMQKYDRSADTITALKSQVAKLSKALDLETTL